MSPTPDAPARLDIAHHFADVPDPRHPAFRAHHPFGDLLVLALCAVLSGARSWDAIARFGRSKLDWLRSLGLTLPNGIPSHDTFNRVFAALDPRAFQDCFTAWINAACGAPEFGHIAIDGKTLRGTRGTDGTCLHLVSAWAAGCRLSLAQVAVAGKSNEITAIPELLRVLDLRGALVSLDAMGCQKAVAKEIRDGGGDYLLAVKDNQPTLFGDIRAAFEAAFAGDFAGVEHDFFATEEISQGRFEERAYAVIYRPEGLRTKDEWADLGSIIQVTRTRRVGGKRGAEVAYYVSSSLGSAGLLAAGIRGHWGIENGCHWSLDVLFGEDRCRARAGNAAENLAWLRKVALGLFGQDDNKGSIPTRQFRAALEDEYRLHLLNLLGE